MHHAKQSLHPIKSMLAINMDVWLKSPRTILMVIFTLLSTFLTVRGYGRSIEMLGYTMHMGESMAWYMLTGFNNMSLVSLSFLVMVSETPRRIPFQQYLMIRSGRKKWIAAQVLNCFLIVTVMLLIVVFIGMLFMMPYITPGNGWSDEARVAAGLEEENTFIPSWARTDCTPFQTCLLSAVPIFLFWLTMVLTILLFSLLKMPSVGITIFGFILFSGTIFVFENFAGIESPSTFLTVGRIVYGYEKERLQRLTIVFSVYAGIIAVLLTFIFVAAMKIDMPTYSTSKN